ncbi:hypothetical protein ELH42_16860 [Rhizobium ruizarguesonis]|uniref:hypothetical protein n=1 Tax=Rhizobium ruizarguesonis TaxID=2081791 RepID=UPI001032418D|nr:hypothetical protein [Rhizobium ruizarguesonis]TBB67726.1 hypothetical protein ELH42_16860 [Rhizobium ruizarguesonis]
MDKDTPAAPTSTEDQTADFRKFMADIQQKLEIGEKRLQIPNGTLSDLHREPDYIMVIKIIAALEPTVNDLIAGGLSKGGGLGGVPNKVTFAPVADFAADRLPLSGRAGKLELAQLLGMLSGEDVAFAAAVSAIRNRYAHNIKNSSRRFIDLVREAKKNDTNLAKKLFYGVNVDFDGMPNGFAKVLLAWSFSQFLENAEQRLQVPKGEFLGGLLGLAISDKDEMERAPKRRPTHKPAQRPD